MLGDAPLVWSRAQVESFFINPAWNDGSYLSLEDFAAAHGLVMYYDPHPYQLVRGEFIDGADNNYFYAGYPDGHAEPVFIATDYSVRVISNSAAEGWEYPTRTASFSELYAQGWRPTSYDAHGYPVPGRVGGFDWIPASAPSVGMSFIDQVLFNYAPGVIFSLMAGAVAGAAFGSGPLATAPAPAAPVPLEAPLPLEAPVAVIQDAGAPLLDAQTAQDIAAGWENAQAVSSAQNIALAEVSGQVEAGTLAATIGDELAAPMLADAQFIVDTAPLAVATEAATKPGMLQQLAQKGVAALSKLAQSELQKALSKKPPSASGAPRAYSSGTLPSPAKEGSVSSYAPILALTLILAAIPLKGR